MNLKKIAVVLALNFVAVAGVQAAGEPTVDNGHGRITFKGSVIEAPCSIDAKSLDQTIELGALSSGHLANGGKSTPVSFSIQLHDCDISTKKTATVTFKGVAGDAASGLDKTFAVTGTGSGIGVAVTDRAGTVIEPGSASQPFPLQANDNELEFTAYAQGAAVQDGDPVPVTPGNFQAVADFVMAYQ